MLMNINSNLNYFSSIDINDHHKYPFFLKTIEFEIFRHIPHLKIDFNHPISVISGTNRSGKTTLLMALACSHTNFMRRNPNNGNLERNTWSSLMKFTNHDKQKNDWTYFITYRKGTKTEKPKRGQRKALTNKWNGIGKKESQFDFRQVIFIDLDRILPARFYNAKVYNEAKKSSLDNLSNELTIKLEQYLSYILEQNFKISTMAKVNDKDVFKYINSFEYSSFNTATGEDVLTRIIIDILEAEKKSLILIDEVEMGLHPKIQRRLMDVIRDISKNDQKQFILTSHSSTILDSVTSESRIFIEKDHDDEYKIIKNISVSAALSKMDAKSFPLLDLYCEDNIAKEIIKKGIVYCTKKFNIVKLDTLINIIPLGTANKVFNNFICHKETYQFKKIKTGYACILDGDMKYKMSDKKLLYPEQDNLHFIFSDKSPEKFLTKIYLDFHPNYSIQYYYDNVNNHFFFQSIIQNSDFTNENDVFNYCWKLFAETEEGADYLELLSTFILNSLKEFSPDL